MNHCLDDDQQVSRRGLIVATGRLAMAAAVIAIAPRAYASGAAPQFTQRSDAHDLGDVRYVVTDRRHPQSVAFARSIGVSVEQSLEVTDGLTRLWQESLVPLWERPEGTVLGVTTRDVWHCLAEQARSQRRQARLLPSGADTSQPLVAWIIT